MEKYSQFRDKGTAIAPFLPVPPAPFSIVWAPVSIGLFLFRLPFLLSISVLYFCVLEWVMVGVVGAGVKYCALWLMLGIPGVWWVDLQVDGVRRGQLATAGSHLPRPGSIIASSFTSPLDPLYLAAIFQPIFTRSYPSTRHVERITLFSAIRLAFSPPSLHPAPTSKKNLVSLAHLTQSNPGKIICVFPETTTTNGRGILPLSPCLLSAGSKTPIYPVNLRYTPQDITTPVPGHYVFWLWQLLHKPTHQMRVRIATKTYNTSTSSSSSSPAKARASGYDTNIFDQPAFKESSSDDGAMHVDAGGYSDGEVSVEEQGVLDRVGEDLARLGRVKRVGLGVGDKVRFLGVWGSRKR